MIRGNFFACIIGKRIIFRIKLSTFLTNHPILKESFLIQELIWCILYLLCKTGFYISFNAMSSIIDDLHWRVILLHRLKISYTHIISERIGWKIVSRSATKRFDWFEVVLMQTSHVISQLFWFNPVKGYPFKFKTHSLHPKYKLAQERMTVFWCFHWKIIIIKSLYRQQIYLNDIILFVPFAVSNEDHIAE